ncbi:MAG: ABC transporter ATP-binding protein [Candidatus Thermoplasmatota archaeon]|jgi:ABC-2 type transport system ATP-binding protein|nr:ABC transporter ATP-binding protein [Candidatus Thermoplasmatota archaeon]MCL5989492.1 ABC transporter ATP-binding protein [Candidatus Thermoplasmatota archaeon]
MIQISSLTKSYKKNQPSAVKNLSLDIDDSEIVGFAGLNGAGKTTTIRVACGIIFPSSGRVSIDGKDIVKEKVQASKNIGWVPELPNFEPNGRAVPLLKYYAGFYGISSSDAESRAEELLKKFSIWDSRKKKLKDYSQGMKKRFAIAAAMMGDPKNFLFDETLNGLDPEGVRDMRNLMVNLRNDGKAVFLSSHILSELENVADRIAIISRGELIKVIERSELSNLGSSFIEINVQNPDDKVESMLEPYGKVERSGNIYYIRNLKINANEGYKINQTLVSSKYNVISMSVKYEGLEDYFLNLVGAGK